MNEKTIKFLGNIFLGILGITNLVFLLKTLNFGHLNITYSIYFLISLLVAYLIYGLYINKNSIFNNKVVYMLFLFSFISFGFHHEAMMGDMDIGDYATRAIGFANTGFFYQHAMPLYTILLSIPEFLGLKLFIINPILLFFSNLFFYLLLSNFIPKKYTILSLIAFNITYATTWFSKQTLSENLWLSLFWGILYYYFLLINSIKNNKIIKIKYLFIILFLGLSALITRLESFILIGLLSSILIFYIIKYSRGIKKVPPLYLFLIIGLLIIGLLNFKTVFFEPPFNKINYFLGPIQKVAEGKNILVSENKILDYETGSPNYKTYLPRYIFDTFEKYGYFIFIFFSLLLLKYIKKEPHIFLTSLYLVITIYLIILIIEPSTGFVQPWFLRHFWVPIISVSFFLSFIFLYNLKTKEYIYCLIILFFLLANIKIITFSEYKGSYDFLKSFSEKIELNKNNEVIDLELPWRQQTHGIPKISTSKSEIIIVVEDEWARNYGTSIAYMNNIHISSLSYYINNKDLFQQYNKIYFLIRSNYLKNFIENKFGNIKFIKNNYLNTYRLNYYRSAHQYAQNWKVPPIKLNDGYEPFTRDIINLPPKNIFEWNVLDFTLYKLED